MRVLISREHGKQALLTLMAALQQARATADLLTALTASKPASGLLTDGGAVKPQPCQWGVGNTEKLQNSEAAGYGILLFCLQQGVRSHNCFIDGLCGSLFCIPA